MKTYRVIARNIELYTATIEAKDEEDAMAQVEKMHNVQWQHCVNHFSIMHANKYTEKQNTSD